MTINSFKDLGEYLFVSATDNNGKKEVGSIYFRNGRIRLVHEDGPKIEGHSYTQYHIRLEHNIDSVEFIPFGDSNDNRDNLEKKFKEKNNESPEVKNRNLYERFKNGDHISRGMPLFVNISAQNLKSIYDIVSICKSKANYFVYNEVAKLNLGFEIYDPKDCNNY